MTVAQSTRKSGPFTLTDGQTIVDYDFPIAHAGELRVLRQRGGAVTELELDVDYAVTGVGVDTGGTIVLTPGAIAGDVVVIAGDLPIERVENFAGFKSLPPNGVNDALDRMTMVLQEMRRDVDETMVVDLVSNQLDARGKRIIDLVPGVDPTDAATVGQMKPFADAAAASAAAAEADRLLTDANLQATGEDRAAVHADTLLAGSSAAAAEAAMNGAALVTTAIPRVVRTALKALDGSSIPFAYLSEAGREGFFVWKTGNFSALVAADPNEGVYVKANAVSATAGAWVRAYVGEVNARWFGVTGNGTTDDTAAVQATVNFVGAQSAYSRPRLRLYGQMKVSATVNVTQPIYICGEGDATQIFSTISDGSPVLNYSAMSGPKLADFTILAPLNFADWLAGTVNAQNCTALKFSPNVNRWEIQNVKLSGCKVGADITGFIGTATNFWITTCETGLIGTLLNSTELNLRMENNRKDFVITASYAMHINQLIAEGGNAGSHASTIDDSRAIFMSAPYYEWTPAQPRTEPYLIVGGSSLVRTFEMRAANISGSSGLVNGVYPILLDQVDGVDVSATIAEGAQGRTIGTTVNTVNIDRLSLNMDSASHIQDGSKQIGPAINYFPNRNFEAWFRGWAATGIANATLSQETTIVRKGANAVKLLATAGTNFNSFFWRLTGEPVVALRGKTIRMGAWVWIPDDAAFDEANRIAKPSVLLQSNNGVTTVAGATRNNRSPKNAWSFQWGEVTVQNDATQIIANVYVNQSATNMAGTEYIAIDSLSIVESNCPLARQMADMLTDSDLITKFIGGRMVASGTNAPTDANQIYAPGDQVWRTNVAAAGTPGYICTTGGPGSGGVPAVFKTMASVAA